MSEIQEREERRKMQAMEIDNTAQRELVKLQEQKLRLENKIEQLVTQLRAGTLDGAGVDELRAFSDDVARLSRRIGEAEQAAEVEKMRRTAIAAQEQSFKFENTLNNLENARAKVLALYRELALALGDHCAAHTAANESAPQSMLPHDANRLRSLALNESMLLETIADTSPFVDGNWRTQFVVAPRKTTR